MSKLKELLNIQPQQKVIYYTGELSADCAGTHDKNAECHVIRRAAWDLHIAEKAVLVQEKLECHEIIEKDDQFKRHYVAYGI
jgi:hypothetical protein